MLVGGFGRTVMVGHKVHHRASGNGCVSDSKMTGTVAVYYTGFVNRPHAAKTHLSMNPLFYPYPGNSIQEFDNYSFSK